MAERPVFVPAPDTRVLVKEVYFEFVWNPGFAPVQKKKNVNALHEAAAAGGYAPLLEVSTKSEHKVGQHLSAFHLKVNTKHLGDVRLECAFQGSKQFERGGPYTDLYSVADARIARRDPRLRNSGQLVGFKFEDITFPAEPKTVFYDWLYVSAILPHREWLSRLHQYAGFTDIEFNPKRSINCQARSCALFAALMRKNLLERAMETPATFINLIASYSYRPEAKGSTREGSLFPK